jgi:DNA polymerase-1
MEFKTVLESRQIRKVWHNYGFDRHVLYNHGIDAQGLAGDTMHMARVWNTSRERARGYSLEALTTDLLGQGKQSMKHLFGRPKIKKVRRQAPRHA